MNKNEKQSIKIDHADHIPNTEWSSIMKFSEGKFDFAIMSKLLTQICVSLPKWKPDSSVRQWNDQRKVDFQWDHEIDYRPPTLIKDGSKRGRDSYDNEKSKNDSSGRSGRARDQKKNKTNHSKKNDRNNKRDNQISSRPSIYRHLDRGKLKQGRSLLPKPRGSVPYGKQCREAGCIKKGVQATHEWSNCSHKEKTPYDKEREKSSHDDQKGRFKKPFHKSGQKSVGLNRDHESSSSSKHKKKFSKKPSKGPAKFGAQNKDRKCWNCGDPGHLSPDCPRQKKINHLLCESEEFTCLLSEQFDTQELWTCSQRMINTYGKKVCWACCKPSCGGTCTIHSDPTSAFMPEAHEIMSQHPDLGTSIQNAIEEVDGPVPQLHYMAPLNHELYYQSQEGHDTTHPSDDDPMELNFQENSRSRSRSSSPTSSRSYHSDDEQHQSQGSDSDPEVDQESHYNSEDEDT